MIIDIHTHLGDILHPGGGALIWQKGVKKKIFYDAISHSELMLHGGFPRFMEEWVYHRLYSLVTKASRARNATATLENMQQTMEESGTAFNVCLPIPPYLTFSD
jgi:hypothetical protein